MNTEITQEIQNIEPVQIVTIKNIITLYRDGQPATGIELIQLEEFGYELVSQKGLYNIGDKAVYIMPDYSLSDIPLFDSFTKPYGDPKKSRLGSRNRIRAIKFNNFYKNGEMDTIFSNGILLPYNEVADYIYNGSLKDDTLEFFSHNYLEIVDLTTTLGIVKWEESDTNSGGLNVGKNKNKFPTGMYKTDETNIENLWGHIEHKIGYPLTLIGTEKVDGSSITIYIKDMISGICSRNLEKEITYNKVVGRRNKNFFEKLMFWKSNFDLNIYEEVFNDDDFIKYGYEYLQRAEIAMWNNIALRGELNGSHLKGSGNKNNPARKENPNIKFFGIDLWDENEKRFIKCDDIEFNAIATELELPLCKQTFYRTFYNKEDIQKECNDYFKNNNIEGIVIRTPDSKFSVKFMNLDYDSKK